jgi:hypothetical protein
MCNFLQGKYPKDFIFSGWHPACMCYVTSILKTKDEFIKDLPSKNEVKQIPKSAQRYVKTKGGKLAKNDWYKDNFVTEKTLPKVKIKKNLGIQTATTITQAESIALKNGISKSVDYSGFSTDMSNNLNSTLGGLNKKYGVQIKEIHGRMQNPNANASAGLIQRSLLVNAPKMNNIADNILNTKVRVLRGSVSSIDASKYEFRTITHEYGHLLFSPSRTKQLSGAIPELKPVVKEFNKLQRSFFKATTAEDRKWLGSYSATNDDEFFAEIFSHFELSSKPNPWSVKFMDFYNSNKKALRQIDTFSF